MIFQYYLQGKEHADELRKKHDEEMIKAKTAEERAQISFKYDKLMQDYLQSLQQKKFDELGRDPKKLYEDAVQYIPALIEHEYRLMTYGANEFRFKELEKFGSGIYRGGKFYVYDYLMLAYVSSNLNAYLEILADNEEYREKLRAEIIKAVNDSPYTYSKKNYRTKAKAASVGAITEHPDHLNIVTFKDYPYVTSFYKDGAAYLTPIGNDIENLLTTNKESGRLEYKNDANIAGELVFDKNGQLGFNMPGAEDKTVQLLNNETSAVITDIDLVPLKMFYSIIYEEFKKSGYKELKDTVSVSVSAFFGRDNVRPDEIAKLVSTLSNYHSIAGVVISTITGKNYPSIYQILNFDSYDSKLNVITFNSPYLNYVIRDMYNLSIRRDKNNEPYLLSDGTPKRLATHSTLIKSEIIRERNRAAIENVEIIVRLIEQCGDNNPHIKASTLVERNVPLSERLKTGQNQRQLLARTFKKTWELLRDKTTLRDKYKNIQLPDPENPAYIPTIKALDTTIFEFKHEGKIKRE